MSRARNVCFTLNNYTEIDEKKIQDVENATFIVFGREIAPKTGTKHLQGYIQWKDQPSFSTMKKRFGNNSIHLEAAKGNGKQNYEYCTKGGDFFEKGVLKGEKGKKSEKIVLRRCGCEFGDKYPCCQLERQYLSDDLWMAHISDGQYVKREDYDKWVLDNKKKFEDFYKSLNSNVIEQNVSEEVLGNTIEPEPVLERVDNIDSAAQ